MDSVVGEGSKNSSPAIIIPEEWANAADTVAYDSITWPPPITLVCGPKNSGKTTFSRHLVNVLLQRYKRVAYLDTDVGQAEFTPPGLLSLTVIDQITQDLTIPCLKTPERCFFFGDISSKRDPTTYLTYIFALYDYYSKQYFMLDNSASPSNVGVPLVINTPGWVKGIGYDILVDLLKYISPTYVVKISISAKSKNLPAAAFWLDEEENTTTTIIEVNSARQDSFKRSVLIQKDARLLRDLRIMAYFRQCFPSNTNITTIKELAHALAAHPPFEISIKISKSNIFIASLNATVVGLAISSDVSANVPHCVGLGIVRGIDTLKGILYVITPVQQNSLEKVDVLLQGFVQIPTCLLQVQGCVSPYMSANILPTD